MERRAGRRAGAEPDSKGIPKGRGWTRGRQGGGGVPWPWALAPAQQRTAALQVPFAVWPSALRPGQTPGKPGKRWGVEPWRGAAYPESPGAPGASGQGGQARAVLQDPAPPQTSTCLSSPTQTSQGARGAHPKAAGSRPGRRGLGPHPSLASSPSTARRRSLRWPTAIVAAAIWGCQNHVPLASSGPWAMWGQGTDPQTHWLGRWPHRLELGTQNRLGLIAWGIY